MSKPLPNVIGSHLIEDGDPKLHEAFCICGKWRFKHESRNKRVATGHRHLGDAIDPPELWPDEEINAAIHRFELILSKRLVFAESLSFQTEPA